MNNTINEEQRTIESLDESWKGVTDIINTSGVGYYKTLQIIQELIKQGVVEAQKKGRYDKYRKIDKITFENGDLKPKEPPVDEDYSNSVIREVKD